MEWNLYKEFEGLDKEDGGLCVLSDFPEEERDEMAKIYNDSTKIRS